MPRPSDHDNFTPLFENVTGAIGVIGASIFGRVWRYCQGNRRVCQASHETIGDELGLHRNTVNRYLLQLVEMGLLIDHTPDLKNRPHTYSIAQEWCSIALEKCSTAQESDTDCTGKVLEERKKRQSKREKTTPDGDFAPDASWPSE